MNILGHRIGSLGFTKLYMTRLRVLLGLIALDIVTKAIALLALAPGVDIDDDAFLQIVLRINVRGVGTWGRALASRGSPTISVVASFALLAFALSRLLAHGRQWSKFRRTLLFGTAIVVPLVLTGFVSNRLAQLPTFAQVCLIRFNGMAFFGVLWALSQPGLWRHATTLFTATAVGNLLSLLIPPHGVVDFIYSSFLANSLHPGVFNIADLYYDVGLALLLVIVVLALVRKISSFTSRGAQPTQSV